MTMQHIRDTYTCRTRDNSGGFVLAGTLLIFPNIRHLLGIIALRGGEMKWGKKSQNGNSI